MRRIIKNRIRIAAPPAVQEARSPAGGPATAAGTDSTGPASSPAVLPVDPVALGHLWADQFRHLTTLGVTGAGGLLITLQAGLVQTEREWWISLILLVVVAALGSVGQSIVVDSATQGELPGRSHRVLRAIAFVCLGAAGGSAIDLFI
jgi:hypothetical protein